MGKGYVGWFEALSRVVSMRCFFAGKLGVKKLSRVRFFGVVGAILSYVV